MYSFGAGVLIATPPGSNPTPLNIGLLQEVDITSKRTIKALNGQYADAIALGAGTRSTTLKAKMARISGLAMATLLYGVSPSAGGDFMSFAEAHSVPSSSPYTVTVAPPSSGTFKQDQGVVYALTGLPLLCVASVSAAGQYSVSDDGEYTFDSADGGAAVLISYIYTITATTSQSFVVPNPLIGPTLNLSANLFFTDPTTNKTGLLEVYNMVSSDLTFGTKLEDFTIPEFDATIGANAANNLWKWNFPDTF